MSSSEEPNSSSEEEFSEEEEFLTKKRKQPVKIQKPASKKSAPAKKMVKRRVVESSSEDEDGSSDASDGSDDDSDDNSTSEEVEVEQKPKKARVPASSSSSSSVALKYIKKKTSSASSSNSSKVNGSTKQRTKMERVEEARKAYKWWEAPELEDGINWHNLEHTGVVFAPDHVRHQVPLMYDGERVELTVEQEELATFYASIPADGPQLGNPKTRGVFQKNFFNDFKNLLPPGHIIKKFEKCDFSLIQTYLETQKSLKKAATDDEKAKRKAAKELVAARHGYSLIDGRIEKVGNYNVEPPGLFRGRGEHPRTGVLKERCFAESIYVNCCENSAVPRVVGLPGHAWESVRHDPTVTWLCKWTENVLDQTKYVMLAASSSFKGKSDQEKYGKAIRLKSCIASIRKNYTTKIKSKDKADRQLGTAMWVIDVLALRVGGEKGEDEADTVGCCSLRVEHIKFLDKDDPTSYSIELEFLGKDSMLFRQTIDFAQPQYGDLAKTVYSCLKSFCAHKKPTDDVFETLSPPVLNKHLSSLMDGLTAKVFRTYNASVTLENELPSAEELASMPIAEKVIRFNAANRQVAILCNHQKTVSKATETMFENLNEKLDMLKLQLNSLMSWKTLCKNGKDSKIPLKVDDKAEIEKVAESLRRAQEAKEKAVTQEEKLKAGQGLEDAKNHQRADQRRRMTQKHMFKTTPTVASIEGRINTWNEYILKLETDIRNRDENKEVALGTSKINYMDPRISVAWCKRVEVPIDKIFAKTLRDKFNWAMAVPPDWKF